MKDHERLTEDRFLKLDEAIEGLDARLSDPESLVAETGGSGDRWREMKSDPISPAEEDDQESGPTLADVAEAEEFHSWQLDQPRMVSPFHHRRPGHAAQGR